MSKKDERLLELEATIILLENEIAENKQDKEKYLKDNADLIELSIADNKIIAKLDSDIKNYEKIFIKKDKQFTRQYNFIQEYKKGLHTLGNAYQDEKICDNGAINKLIEHLDEMKAAYDKATEADRILFSEVKDNG